MTLDQRLVDHVRIDEDDVLCFMNSFTRHFRVKSKEYEEALKAAKREPQNCVNMGNGENNYGIVQTHSNNAGAFAQSKRALDESLTVIDEKPALPGHDFNMSLKDSELLSHSMSW